MLAFHGFGGIHSKSLGLLQELLSQFPRTRADGLRELLVPSAAAVPSVAAFTTIPSNPETV